MLENPTGKFSALCISCMLIAGCLSDLVLTCLYAGMQQPKSELAIRLVYPPFFCKFCFLSSPTKNNLTELSLEIFPVHALTSSWEDEIQLHSFFISAVDASQWLPLHPGRFTPGERARGSLIGSLICLQ
jgi:hypothetical protein